ncbi:piggyBac transposable element-derived protein 4-like [Stegodyphus dumicola]|uniref:piggyBac transposable element-derived protein 4-like n=1 Tax=Stegodyphus dumicola TaxID=202533 RepID=UPI0015B1CA48|nr:piggyBac transposable element-derived protein 4-like [Stegodyphus dumicola]
MAYKRKFTGYEKEMECLRTLVDEVESSEEEIDQDSENESDEEIFNSHDSESEFEKNVEDDRNPDLVKCIFINKNNTVWQKGKPNQKVKTSSQNIITHLPGLKGTTRNITEPLESWELFFNAKMIRFIVERTNIYIEKISLNYTRDQDAKTTNDVEIRALFGLLYLCNLLKSSHTNTQDLSATDGSGTEILQNAMSYKRFNFLLGCLRLDSVTNCEARKKLDKLAAVREYFDDFNENCQKIYIIGEYITNDEKLEKFRGRCSFRQYIPSRPAKYGIKIFALIDLSTFYSYNMEIYVGQQPEGPFRVENSPFEITKRLCTSLFGSGRNVTMDNLYTSYPLAKELLSKKLTVVGNLEKNKAEIPTEFVQIKTRKVYSSIFGFQKNATLVSYVPKKSKCVVLLSTMHHDDAIDESDDTKKPEIIHFYNATKGGVDKVDEMSSLYSTARKTNRWPMVVFYCVLNVVVINARVAFRCNKCLSCIIVNKDPSFTVSK